jgi:CRP/FNR family transcriptional regulator, cyclic AMP receptor protein
MGSLRDRTRAGKCENFTIGRNALPQADQFRNLCPLVPANAATSIVKAPAEHQQAPAVPTDLIQLLSRTCGWRSLHAGGLLFEEGDVCNTLYILESGQLKVFTLGSKGRELVYNVLGPGALVGEMFLDGEPRSASVKATEACECLVVPGERMRELLRAHPDFAEFLVINLISRLRNATRKVRSLAMEGVYERTVTLLEEVAIGDGAKRRIPGALTQGEIASRIGATREMVNHVLRDLTRGGFIEKQGHQRLITKPLPKRW